MSGFTRDPRFYGDRLVYEPLESKWRRYHGNHCGCGQDWVTAHAIPAGFTVLPRGKTGYYALVGPGLTEDVDEDALTVNALWEAVTGKPGTQDWFERAPARPSAEELEQLEAARKAENKRDYALRRERAAKAQVEPATAKQVAYLEGLVAKSGIERFDTEYARAVEGTATAPRAAEETSLAASQRLTKKAASKLIDGLKNPATFPPDTSSE